MTQKRLSQTSSTRSRLSKRGQKTTALLGLGIFASSLAVLLPSAQNPSKAQNQTGPTGYCFFVLEPTKLYSEPSFNAELGASFNAGDKAYATMKSPYNRASDRGITFVEVAIYEGNIAWIPFFTLDGTKLLEEYPSEDCPNPGDGAAINAEGGETAFCFDVQTEIGVYERPSFSALKVADYLDTDIAYATANPPISVPYDDGTSDRNSFVEVAIYGGNIGWVPRYPEGVDAPALIDLSGPQDCPNPGPGAFGAK
jgi:hypothetical protein